MLALLTSSELKQTLRDDGTPYYVQLAAMIRQTFRVVSSMPQEAAELDIRMHDPIVRVRRIFQNKNKEVICLAQLAYRTDGVVFDINIDLESRSRLLELGGVPE